MLLTRNQVKGVVLLVVCFCLSLTACTQGEENKYVHDVYGDYGIAVTGTGEISVVPDIAVFYVSSEVEAKNVTDATKRVSRASQKIIALLNSKGITGPDVVTSSVNISPRYDWSRDVQTVVGYIASVSMQITVREIAEVGQILDSVIEAGGNTIRLNGLRFDIEDRTEYILLARELAAKDARDRAEQLAVLHGVKLGQPIRISEFDTPSYSPYARAEMHSHSDGLPIEPGSLAVSVSLAVQWSIEETD